MTNTDVFDDRIDIKDEDVPMLTEEEGDEITLIAVQQLLHKTHKANGWDVANKHRSWEGIINEVACELMEAYEQAKEDKFEIYFDGDKPQGELIELADTVTRILNTLSDNNEELNVDIKPTTKQQDKIAIRQIDHFYNLLMSDLYDERSNFNSLNLIIESIFFYCKKAGADLISAILLKDQYNQTRGYKHGNKRF